MTTTTPTDCAQAAPAARAAPAIWRYHVPPSTNGSFVSTDFGGTFFLTEDGYLTCVTDRGNYGYRWSHIGTCHIKDFLCQLEPSYLASKLGSRTAWPRERVEAHLREIITREVADEEDRAELLEQVSEASQSEFDFGVFYSDNPQLDLHEDFPERTYDGDLLGFLEHLWPRFVAMLKAEQREKEETP